MITITIIICLTLILIVAIICYKEYKLSNNNSFNEIKTELKQLNAGLNFNDRILSNLAKNISYLSKENDENRTSK